MTTSLCPFMCNVTVNVLSTPKAERIAAQVETSLLMLERSDGWMAPIYSVRVTSQEIIAAIDAEIQRLQQARKLISGLGGTKRRGTPPVASARKAKRTLSAEAREKIAAAQRTRWAKQKRPTVTKLPPKHAPVKRPRKPVALKTKPALTGRVPSGPVAAPAPKS
jgi:hypothetical protein